MAMNNYFPVGYLQGYQQGYPQQMTNQMQNNAPANNNGIIWVQGIESAKAYPVNAGNSVLLMDSEEPLFFIKSADVNGMPMPLRVFDYTERSNKKEQDEPVADYITRDELDDILKDYTKKKAKEVKKDE